MGGRVIPYNPTPLFEPAAGAAADARICARAVGSLAHRATSGPANAAGKTARRMAEAIGDGLAAGGVPYKLIHMAVTDRSDALVEVFRSRAVLVGSPTINMGLLSSIMPILEDLRGLKFKNKVGAAFGSYGWSGESVRLIEEHFERCRIPLAAPHALAKWQPTPEDLEKCREMGRTVAKAVVAAVPA